MKIGVQPNRGGGIGNRDIGRITSGANAGILGHVPRGRDGGMGVVESLLRVELLLPRCEREPRATVAARQLLVEVRHTCRKGRGAWEGQGARSG